MRFPLGKARLFLTLAVCFVAPNLTAGTYSFDSGTTTGLGLGPFGAQGAVWLNAFQVTAGMEQISSISIMFGSNPPANGQPANGTPINLVLYTDPNNDGNPVDGVLQRSVAGTVQLSNTNTFVNFPISPIVLSVSNWFYVGMSRSDGTGSTSIFGPNVDDADGGGPSYLLIWFSGFDQNNLGSSFASSQTPVAFDLMIRADGMSPSAVPEPATYALSGLGVAALLLLRRSVAKR